MAAARPQVTLHAAPHADGSASFSHGGFSILAVANGPLEAQRRDELPDEAFVEVSVRPASGAGSPRDRHLETIVARTLRSVILLSALPRSLLQLTLQILRTPHDSSTTASPAQSDSVLSPLPALLNAAVLALLAGNIPLRCTCTAVLVDVLDSGNAQSGGRHVFAFAGPSGECLLAESEGEFSLQEWQQAEKQAQRQCRGDNGLELWLRRLIEDDLGTRGRWRGDTA